MQLIVYVLLGALATSASSFGLGVFHDGIRPLLSETSRGDIDPIQLRKEAWKLSRPFIMTMGIVYFLATGVLNPWFVFLLTDFIGVSVYRKWYAPILGALLGSCIWKIQMAYGVYYSSMRYLPDVARVTGMTVLASTLFILPLALYKWRKNNTGLRLDKSQVNENIERFLKLPKNEYDKNKKWWLLFAGIGSLLAVSAHHGWLFGSEVTALASTIVPEGSYVLYICIALFELLRALGYMPMIASMGTMTGVYSVTGLLLPYVVGYVSPSPLFALVAGGTVSSVSFLMIPRIFAFINGWTTIRTFCDQLRTTYTEIVEKALVIGGVLGVVMTLNPFVIGSVVGIALIGYLRKWLIIGISKPILITVIGTLFAELVIWVI